eukprot:3995450-Amphidinium_carterae.1
MSGKISWRGPAHSRPLASEHITIVTVALNVYIVVRGLDRIVVGQVNARVLHPAPYPSLMP